jgi:tricorn protease interacting factor F2/3
MSKKESAILSDNISPNTYSIELTPSKNLDEYTGKIEIKASIIKPTKNMILHSKDLIIKSATICVGTQCLLPILKEDKKNETIILKNMRDIPKGEIEIHIEFYGKITDSLSGIYKSKYEDNGKTEYLITTQCEASYARRIFPCFDEPNKKANFNISVKIDKSLIAISNMLIKSESIEENLKKIEFKTTPKMSTYLFYLGIGKFEYIEDKYKNTRLRVITTPGKKESGRFALNLAKKYLEYFENYSEIPYPLEKLDLIAIPDFAAGAMENWGAMTFREMVLLVDKETSARIKKRVAEIIAHEIWHQWSGNLVTMKWWNDLWLNESFANYMAYKAVDHFNPEWKIWEDFLYGEASRGLFKDSLKSTHPIEVEVNSPREIEEIFDEISYAKGGCVLRMLEAYVGEEKFRLGVSSYLKKHSYQNAEAQDLWNAIAKTTGDFSIKNLMKTWISQSGYPIIEVSNIKDKIKIKQSRCNSSNNQIWPIPLSITSEGICYNKLLSKKEETYDIPSNKIKLNHEQYGFYRVKYSKEIEDSLKELIRTKSLSVADRWGLNSDFWALCNIAEKKVNEYLDFLEYYSEEESYIILSEIFASIRKLDRLLTEEKFWISKKEKIVNKLLPPYKKILEKTGINPKNDEEMEITLQRSTALGFCIFAGDKEVTSELLSKYARKDVPMNIADSVYHAVAINGNEKDFNEMIKNYKSEKDLERKTKLLVALYSFTQKEIIKNALDFSISKNVRTQDIRYIFGSVVSNPNMSEPIKKWFESNYDKLVKYQTSHFIFETILEAYILSQRDLKTKKECESFMKKNKISYEMIKRNALEILDMNIKLIENAKKEFKE